LLWLLACISILATAIYWRVRPGWRRSGPFLPDGLLLGLWLYAAGITWLLAFEPEPHQARVACMAWTALASAATGATIFCVCTGNLYQEAFVRIVASARATSLEHAGIAAGLVLSATACVLFLYLVLRIDAIAALLGIGSFASDFNLLRARVLIASGTEAWLAPGYFKQFRDILLPVLLAAAIVADRRRLQATWFWALAALALLAMLVSGQRLVVVVFLAALTLAAHYARTAARPAAARVRRLRGTLVPASLVIAGYGLLTLLLGRVRDDAIAGSPALRLIGNFLDRAFLAAPRENAITYPVWSESGPSAGLSWVRDFEGILPGVGETLSNVLHMATGGSALGNSPLGLAPDVWLAWGWPGLLLVPATIALLAGFLDLACRARGSPSLIGLRIYLFLILPVCYSPFIFVLYGGAVAAAILAMVFIARPAMRVTAVAAP